AAVAAGSAAGISITAVESSDSGGSPLLQQGEAALEGSGSELSLFSSFGASAPDSSAKAPENNMKTRLSAALKRCFPPAKAGGFHQACNASHAGNVILSHAFTSPDESP